MTFHYTADVPSNNSMFGEKYAAWFADLFLMYIV